MTAGTTPGAAALLKHQARHRNPGYSVVPPIRCSNWTECGFYCDTPEEFATHQFEQALAEYSTDNRCESPACCLN